MTLKRVSIPSPNYSSRGGSAVRLIVIHTAEGSLSYTSLGGYFANPASQVSSHTGIDDTPNTVGEYVSRNMKAWTAANANPVAVQTELCGFAAWDIATWNSHSMMLQNCAQWIAEEASFFNIPLVRLSASQAQTNGRGICRHMDLGTWGGNHSDPGAAFPIDQVIAIAKGGTPTPPPTPEVDVIAPPVSFNWKDKEQTFYIDNGTLVHAYAGPGEPWAVENLGSGWDPDSGLSYNMGPSGTPKVWGVLKNGKRAQCYWAGTQWVTQSL